MKVKKVIQDIPSLTDRSFESLYMTRTLHQTLQKFRVTGQLFCTKLQPDLGIEGSKEVKVFRVTSQWVKLGAKGVERAK